MQDNIKGVSLLLMAGAGLWVVVMVVVVGWYRCRYTMKYSKAGDMHTA